MTKKKKKKKKKKKCVREISSQCWIRPWLSLRKNRWIIFRSIMPLAPEKATIMVLAAITLHNFLRISWSADKIYIPPGLIDEEDPKTGTVIPGTWHHDAASNSWLDLPPCTAHNATFKAKEIRREFTQYFMMEGAVSWKWKSANLRVNWKHF